MKIQQIYENAHRLCFSKKNKHIDALVKVLTPESQKLIKATAGEAKVFATKSQRQFVLTQAIRTCIEMELSANGKRIRSKRNLPKIDWDAEIS